MTKSQLQNLKGFTNPLFTLEEAERIDSCVSAIYRKVLDTAENTNDQVVYNRIYAEYDSFYAEHLNEILTSLQMRLPDSKVEKRIIISDSNGILREGKSSGTHSFFKNTYIVIDWS